MKMTHLELRVCTSHNSIKFARLLTSKACSHRRHHSCTGAPVSLCHITNTMWMLRLPSQSQDIIILQQLQHSSHLKHYVLYSNFWLVYMWQQANLKWISRWFLSKPCPTEQQNTENLKFVIYQSFWHISQQLVVKITQTFHIDILQPWALNKVLCSQSTC